MSYYDSEHACITKTVTRENTTENIPTFYKTVLELTRKHQTNTSTCTSSLNFIKRSTSEFMSHLFLCPEALTFNFGESAFQRCLKAILPQDVLGFMDNLQFILHDMLNI